MALQSTFFVYDVVLALSSSQLIRQCLPTIESTYAGRRMLAATMNHRLFNLHDKNFIKACIETHALDHIMFSMRPSSTKLITECQGINIEKFKDLSQLVFVLQIMGRYDITVGIVEANFLADEGRDSIRVAEVEDRILSFLDAVTSCFPAHANIEKQLPWLFSIHDVLLKVRDKELVFLRAIQQRATEKNYEYDDHQISPLEKDLFWVGFDPTFKQVPPEKEYPTTKWTELTKQSAFGSGLFEKNLRYCTRCCLPETVEGISFDEVGICVPCRSSEEKMHINWEKRQHNLDTLIESYRSSSYYDCMLPMSGGKDSTYQAHILKHVLSVTPLAVTHGQNWGSVVGRYNLENCLQKFDLDHIVFNMNRAVINRVARKSLGTIGDACWHCHIGAGAFPVQTALAWRVNLMCFGESTAEADGRGSYEHQAEASLFYNLEISAKVKAEDIVDTTISARDVSAWNYPSHEQLKDSRIRYIHLGDYFFWDEERQVEFVKRHYEWMESHVENAYKGFKSVECVMAGVHDYANFIKRGIGRATVQASTDVRRGLLTREEGFELAKQFDTQRPHALDYYLKLTGLSEEEFERTLRNARAGSKFASKLKNI